MQVSVRVHVVRGSDKSTARRRRDARLKRTWDMQWKVGRIIAEYFGYVRLGRDNAGQL
jgi:hypothetical protein